MAEVVEQLRSEAEHCLMSSSIHLRSGGKKAQQHLMMVESILAAADVLGPEDTSECEGLLSQLRALLPADRQRALAPSPPKEPRRAGEFSETSSGLSTSPPPSVDPGGGQDSGEPPPFSPIRHSHGSSGVDSAVTAAQLPVVSVASWLSAGGLAQFTTGITAEGYDELWLLRTLEPNGAEVSSLAETLRMRPGHKRKLTMLLERLQQEPEQTQATAVTSGEPAGGDGGGNDGSDEAGGQGGVESQLAGSKDEQLQLLNRSQRHDKELQLQESSRWLDAQQRQADADTEVAQKPMTVEAGVASAGEQQSPSRSHRRRHRRRHCRHRNSGATGDDDDDDDDDGTGNRIFKPS